MKLKGLIFLLLMAISATTFAQKRSLTELADEAFESKQYVTAIDLYKKAYTKVKGNRQEKNRIMFQQAECYRLMDDKTLAIKTYQRLVKAKYYTVQPKIFLYMADLIMFLIHTGINFKSAITDSLGSFCNSSPIRFICQSSTFSFFNDFRANVISIAKRL